VLDQSLINEFAELLPAAPVNPMGGMDFIVKDELGMKIPDYYLPGTMGAYAKGLVSRWVACLVELGAVTKFSKPFSVGFLFSEDAEGQHECTQEFGSVLYVNPVEVSGGEGKPRVLKRKFSFDAKGNWEILTTAVHEWVHFLGFSGHDVEFANKLTEVFGLVLKDRKRFGRIFDKGGDQP
jgi:hypothetical protein